MRTRSLSSSEHDPGLPLIYIRVGEAGLEGIKRQMATGSEPSGEIASVDQGEPDASLGRGLGSARDPWRSDRRTSGHS